MAKYVTAEFVVAVIDVPTLTVVTETELMTGRVATPPVEV